ncbi:MAG TPA: hypothetical protein VKP58_13610 [Candidatus Acidoferrum sp.]|nr:hypothetical protein [Candidatus Acidoferrum sp.]
MALDAVVYRNPRNLPAHLKERVIRNNESTELLWRDDADGKTFGGNNLKAWHEHLGNIAMVAFLRKQVAELFTNRETILLVKILYNGVHAGDWISPVEIARLEGEVEELDSLTKDRQLQETSQFIVKMRNLISAAKREESGIVF